MTMKNYDSWLEAPYHGQDDQSDEIAELTYQLMKPGAEYDYRTTQAIAEAMGDLDAERADALQAMIDTNDYEKIGRKVMMMALDYMERFAKDAAENELND
jgi:hypothetical protein